MNNDLIEQVARAIFACHFADTAQAQAMLERDWPRGSPIKLMVQREAQAAIAVMQPHIEAQREAAARDALEAAADAGDKYAAWHNEHDDGLSGFGHMALAGGEIADEIRAIDPAQFRGADDADL